MIVCFVDIGRIEDNHRLSFLFVITAHFSYFRLHRQSQYLLPSEEEGAGLTLV